LSTFATSFKLEVEVKEEGTSCYFLNFRPFCRKLNLWEAVQLLEKHFKMAEEYPDEVEER